MFYGTFALLSSSGWESFVEKIKHQKKNMAKVQSLFKHYLTVYLCKLIIWIYIVQTDVCEVSHDNKVKSMI